jgi:hypothetical protein
MLSELFGFFAYMEIEEEEKKYRNDMRLMLNLDKKRNKKNVSHRVYNCGGYALNTYNWYRPAENIDFDYGKEEMTEEEMAIQTQKCVDFMIKQFGGLLRVIQGSWELQKDEYMIAFKIDGGGNDDFHYCKRLKNGHWYHKQGQFPICKIKKEKVFKEHWIFDDTIYYGKTVFFAMKEN